MKKRILSIAVTAILLLSVLSLSACGFFGGEALEIEGIYAIPLDDGSYDIMVKYYDMDPMLICNVPKGTTGDAGEKGDAGQMGVGIEGITVTPDTNGRQKLTITYTDDALSATEFWVKDGVHITSTERVDRTDGSYMLLYFSDGSIDEIRLPEGIPGAGIVNASWNIDASNGDTVVTFELNDGTKLSPVTIKAGQRGKSIDRVETTSWEEDGRSIGYVLNFYLEGSLEPLATVRLRHGMDGVGVERLVSEPIMDGDVKIGTRFYFEKTDGTTTDGIEVMDGVGVKDVSYRILTNNETEVTLLLTDGTKKSFTVPAAVSIREVDTDVHTNGDIVLTFHLTNGESKAVLLKKAVGIENVEIVNNPDNVATYKMIITYSDGTTDETVFFKPTAWLHGLSAPSNSLGNNGDYYFDHHNSVIYYKEQGRWQLVIDLDAASDCYSVTFIIDPSQNEAWSFGTSTYSYDDLQKGDSFAGHQYSIPNPTRTPSAEESAAGITAYRFVGWTVEKDSENVTVTTGFFTDLTPVSGNLTLYPLWEAIYEGV